MELDYSRPLVESLETFTKPESIPAPQFGLFEVAVMRWQCDDDAAVHDELVQIVGLAWNPSDSLIEGWVYHARNLYKPVGGHLLAGHQEDCFETELIKISTLRGCDRNL